MAELGPRGQILISAMTDFVSLTTGTKSFDPDTIGRILSKAFLPLTDLFNDSLPAHVFVRSVAFQYKWSFILVLFGEDILGAMSI